MIKRYDPGIARDWETCDDEAVLEEAPKGVCVLVEDMKAELLRISFNSYTLEEYQSALNKLIEELK